MINLKDFKPGNVYYYSDFGDSEYCQVKALKIRKIGRGKYKNNFWFFAEIVENEKMKDKKYYKIGSIHGFSNSFMFGTLSDLKTGCENYKEVQAKFLIKTFGLALKAKLCRKT